MFDLEKFYRCLPNVLPDAYIRIYCSGRALTNIYVSVPIETPIGTDDVIDLQNALLAGLEDRYDDMPLSNVSTELRNVDKLGLCLTLHAKYKL